MNKPKYKIGDILHDPLCSTYEVIKAIKRDGDNYKYLVIEIVDTSCYSDGKEVVWCEETIDVCADVVGNMFDKR